MSSQGNMAAFVAQTVPAQMTAGLIYNVSVTMKNTGSTTWTRAGEYKLGAQNPQDTSRWGTTRVELTPADSIAPGATKRFDFQVRAPATTGTQPFQWRMLREFVEWFGDFTPVVNVNVTASTSLRVKYRYHVIACGYPRYGRDEPADRINARWPEFGYWKDGVVNGTWMARAQNTEAYGRRTLGLCRDNQIRILTGWWDINDRVALDNTLAAFSRVDLKAEPLRLAYMFGAQNFKNPNKDPLGRPLESAAIIEQMVRDRWAPDAANRERYAWITDGLRQERPIVMIWGDPGTIPGTNQPSPARNTFQYRDYLLNRIRPLYRAATRAEPFIIMVNHALFPWNIRDEVYKGLDGVYNHACGFDPSGRAITTRESVPLTETIFNNDLTAMRNLRNWEGKALTYFPGSMPQYDEDRLADRTSPRYVLAAAATEDDGRAQVTSMFRLVKSYAPTLSITQGSGDCDLVVNKWVTLTSFSEWPEGATIEPSLVRGRKYQGSTADPRNARCDYGTDFIDIIRQLFSDRVVNMTRRDLEAQEPLPIP
ncbi:MAG TPA: hypothetical protein VF297_12625 [Pyrinomonadaceae bacterium]